LVNGPRRWLHPFLRSEATRSQLATAKAARRNRPSRDSGWPLCLRRGSIENRGRARPPARDHQCQQACSHPPRGPAVPGRGETGGDRVSLRRGGSNLLARRQSIRGPACRGRLPGVLTCHWPARGLRAESSTSTNYAGAVAGAGASGAAASALVWRSPLMRAALPCSWRK